MPGEPLPRIRCREPSRLALNSGSLRCSKSSGIESSPDDLRTFGHRRPPIPTWSELSLDHLVAALLEKKRHVEAKRLGGLELNHHLYLNCALTGSSLGFT